MTITWPLKVDKSLIKSEKKKTAPRYQDVFGDTIIELANKNDQIVGVTPAMLSGSSLNKMITALKFLLKQQKHI